LPRKSCKVLMSCMILSSKVFQRFNELRHFSRKQNFWPEEAKNSPLYIQNRAAPIYGRSAIFRSSKGDPLFHQNRGTPIIHRGAILAVM
jgi:hypothetical protein